MHRGLPLRQYGKCITGAGVALAKIKEVNKMKIEISKRNLTILTLAAVLVLAFAFWTTGGVAKSNAMKMKAELQGYEEVPAISTMGSGELKLKVSKDETSMDYELSYAGLEGVASASHIHLGQRGVNGAVIAFLCGGGGKPPCPTSGTVTGTINSTNIIAAQGIAAGEFAEALQAMRSGVTYANVHTTSWPGGEIRGQIK